MITQLMTRVDGHTVSVVCRNIDCEHLNLVTWLDALQNMNMDSERMSRIIMSYVQYNSS